jgi:alkyl hydroperoxide reductase subunit AhpC
MLGQTAPDFHADTTEGPIQFHEWIGDQWAVFFSHPADFTPVCTTELGSVAKMKDQFTARNAKVIALSTDSLEDHKAWVGDIEETQNAAVNFPIIADPEKRIAELYGMVHPEAAANVTVRAVYIIDHNKKVRASITYPPSTGRNFSEILRVIDSLQLTDNYKVATPVDWSRGDDVIVVPSLTDPDEIARLFPKGVREIKPYLRITPQPDV